MYGDIYVYVYVYVYGSILDAHFWYIIAVLVCPADENSSTYLKLALTWKDADPFVVIIGNDDVTIGVDSHARRPLQLTWSPAPDTKAAFKQTIVWENL